MNQRGDFNKKKKTENMRGPYLKVNSISYIRLINGETYEIGQKESNVVG